MGYRYVGDGDDGEAQYEWFDDDNTDIDIDAGGGDDSSGGGDSSGDINTDTYEYEETPAERAARLDEEQNEFYRSIGLDPASVKDWAPEEKAKVDAMISGDLFGASPELVKTLMGAFKRTVNGKEVTDWDKVGLVGGMFAKATGLTKPEVPGYKGNVKNYTAVRNAIDYNDPNRRPGSGGLNYFTPTQYIPAGGDVAAAKAAARNQEEGILSGYTRATAPTSTWNATNSVAMPWNKPATTGTTGTTTGTTGTAAKVMTPEEKLNSLQPATAASARSMSMNASSGADLTEEDYARLFPEEYANRFGAEMPTPSAYTGERFDVPDESSNGPIGPVDPMRIELPAMTPEEQQKYDAEYAQKVAANPGTPSIGEQLKNKFNPVKPVLAAQGGIMHAAKGRYLRGQTDGMADKLNTSIDNKQPAKLSHGEFVVPADVVSHLGNGNSDAGAKKLYQMMDRIRIARTGTKQQGRRINPDKFMPGGSVGYSGGGITDVMPKRFVTGGPASNTSTAGNLSEWVGDYATTAVGQGAAAADRPYEAYKGATTAGPSNLQQQQFAGISSLATTGVSPTQFTTGTFDVNAANKYMNPYIQAALDPQLKEMQRQADIQRVQDAGRLVGAGAYGGSRQAIMESEGRRNLMDKQSQAIGSGYATAYDKAMQQYNSDMNRGLQTEQAQQGANMDSANFSRGIMQDLGQAGATQRGIEQEGLTADKTEFEKQRDYDMKMAQYKLGLLQGLPTSTQVNTQNQNSITELLQSGNTLAQLLEKFKTN